MQEEYSSAELMHAILDARGTLANRIDRVDLRMTSLETRFDRLETRFDRLDTRFARFETRFECIETRVERLEERVDHGFSSTGEQLKEVNTRLERLERGRRRPRRDPEE